MAAKVCAFLRSFRSSRRSFQSLVHFERSGAHSLLRWALLLALLAGGATPALAREAAGDGWEPYDIPGEVRALQELLAVLGHYDQEPTGQWDDETSRALEAFQAAEGLPVTGELDDATLEALGGPTSRMNDRPRFRYAPANGESLAAVARRFASTLPWIARYNPAVQSPGDEVPEGGIVVPVPFPLPEGLAAERVEVLPGRFLGTYASDVPFAGVGRLAEHMAAMLEDAGYEVEKAATPLDGITLRGKGVVLGRVVFSASPSGGTARVHVGLVFVPQEELEQELEEGGWLQVGEAEERGVRND